MKGFCSVAAAASDAAKAAILADGVRGRACTAEPNSAQEFDVLGTNLTIARAVRPQHDDLVAMTPDPGRRASVDLSPSPTPPRRAGFLSPLSLQMTGPGTDTEGNEYGSLEEMWGKFLSPARGGRNAWYGKAVDFWTGEEATADGMLGGHGKVSPADIRDSTVFLRRTFRRQLAEKASGALAGRPLVCLDCGAGVGRVSQEFLLHHFDVVDLCEPVGKLIQKAEVNLKEAQARGVFPQGHRADRFLHHGLQDCPIEPGRYDAVWVQWALLYLTDDDAVALLKRAAAALRPGGVIYIKENVTADDTFVVDCSDCSITRAHPGVLDLIHQADLVCIATARQTNFPRDLFPVQMYAVTVKE